VAFWGDIELRNKFWGKAVELFPVGTLRVRFGDNGDEFVWSPVTSCIHNVAGEHAKMWVDHYGEITLTNRRTGDAAHVMLNRPKLRGERRATKPNYEVNGELYAGAIADGNMRYILSGVWNQHLLATPVVNGVLNHEHTAKIWQPAELPPAAARQYGLSRFAVRESTRSTSHLPIHSRCPGTTRPTKPWLRRVRPKVRLNELHAAEEAFLPVRAGASHIQPSGAA
jgi:hypothetical protein